MIGAGRHDPPGVRGAGAERAARHVAQARRWPERRLCRWPRRQRLERRSVGTHVEPHRRKVAADGVEALAQAAATVNASTENIGARRLYTVIEKVLEEVLFHAPDMAGTTVTVDAGMVDQRLKDVIEDRDLSRYIL